MPDYYVNPHAQSNGDHEVHREDCIYMKEIGNPEYVGFFWTCREAVEKAKETYPTADGCKYCSPECHHH